VHARLLDKIIFEHGIDRSGMFCGAINGNVCRRLMANADSIVGAGICDFVLGQETRIGGTSDDLISMMFATPICCLYHLQALNGCFKVAWQPSQLTPAITDRAEKVRDKCLELDQHLQLKVLLPKVT
jgi:hypothetical protein